MKKIIWKNTTQEHLRCIYQVYILPFTSSVSIYIKHITTWLIIAQNIDFQHPTKLRIVSSTQNLTDMLNS